MTHLSHNSPEEMTPLTKTMIRVNHAGEFSAKRIYEGQLTTLTDEKSRLVVKQMAQQEAIHLNHFSHSMTVHDIAPTRFLALWDTLSYGLGALTGALGPKTAMACTVIVEAVIEDHYKTQIERLCNIHPTYEPYLQELITTCLSDEEEHRHIATYHKGEEMPGFSFFKRILTLSLKTAIKLSEKA